MFTCLFLALIIALNHGTRYVFIDSLSPDIVSGEQKLTVASGVVIDTHGRASTLRD